MIETQSDYRKPLALALDGALKYLQSLDTACVGATADAATLHAQLQKRLGDDGVPAERVVEDLIADVAGGLTGSAGGRFFAWVMGGALPSALAADWLAATWDQNAAQFTAAPAAAMVESIAGAWLKDVLNVPAEASFAFVTGCQMAHATCLAAARHALLARHGWDVERNGLYGAPAIRVITGDAHHGSIGRAMRLLGMGTEHLVSLPVERSGKLGADALRDALIDAGDAPKIVLLQAGDINTGVFDDFEALIPLAKQHDAWVHVDGAIGLWASASPRTRHLTDGIDRADSWATDGHKLLNVPYDSGYAFVRDAQAHRAAMFAAAPYIPMTAESRDAMAWNPEWSRRARGFATYAALRELGRSGIARLVDRCCQYAHAIATGIAAIDDAELLWEPTFNQGLVRFHDPRSNATEEDHDRFTDAVVAAIVERGEVFFGATTWRSRRAMRVSVCNWQTTERDVERAIRAVEAAVGERSS